MKMTKLQQISSLKGQIITLVNSHKPPFNSRFVKRNNSHLTAEFVKRITFI
jgi:hypothetical protein